MAAHEVFHIVQVKSGCGCRIGPMWLWEGFPKLFAWMALDYAGLYDFAGARDDILQQSWSVRERLELLSDSSEFRRTENSYALAFEATYFLSGDSPLSLINFWDAVGRGTSWQQAFSDEFGITLKRFYEEFEAYWMQNPNNPRNLIYPFRIEFLQGPLPYWLSEKSDAVTYLFQVYGVDLESVGDDLPAYPIMLSPQDAGWRTWGMIRTRNLIFVRIFKTVSLGTVYQVTFTLPDGRKTSATFTHRVP